MHPLIARIHPAFRIALTAWLLSRGALWIFGGPGLAELTNGAPLPGVIAALIDQAAAAVPTGAMTTAVHLLPWAALECLMLWAGVAVYRFARTTDLPQIAERACWLWFFNPLLAFHFFDWGTQIALATGTLAVSALVTRRPRLAAMAAVVAIGCRLEFVVLWPALALAGWHHYRHGGQTSETFWLPAAIIPAAFTAWIATSWHLAGTLDTSLRAVHGDLIWRDAAAWAPTSPAESLFFVAAASGLFLALRYARRLPRWYLFAAVPLLAWPLLQIPAHQAAIVVAWSLPTFTHLAIATDDRSLERAVMAGFVIGFCAVAATLL
jgi:hypothetical protein